MENNLFFPLLKKENKDLKNELDIPTTSESKAKIERLQKLKLGCQKKHNLMKKKVCLLQALHGKRNRLMRLGYVGITTLLTIDI